MHKDRRMRGKNDVEDVRLSVSNKMSGRDQTLKSQDEASLLMSCWTCWRRYIHMQVSRWSCLEVNGGAPFLMVSRRDWGSFSSSANACHPSHVSLEQSLRRRGA